ncbi:MAG: hypothetical protein AAF962_19935 [Actinomycetota bacterium]
MSVDSQSRLIAVPSRWLRLRTLRRRLVGVGTGRFGIGARVATVVVAALAVGAPTPADDASLLGVVACDRLDERAEREELDFRGQRQVLTTTGCLRAGAPVAFLHRYAVAPPVQPLVAPDDPTGLGMTVMGDGWRLDLVGELTEDHDLAERLASSTGGEVMKRLSPVFCVVYHPDPSRQA